MSGYKIEMMGPDEPMDIVAVVRRYQAQRLQHMLWELVLFPMLPILPPEDDQPDEGS